MPQPGRRPAINPDDVLEKLEETGALFHSTGEIADMMDASKPTVLDRLRTLEEQGRVRSRKVAGNTPIWYLPEVENRRLDEYSNGGSGEEPDDTDDGGKRETPEGADEPEALSDGGRTRLERWTAWLTADGALITGAGLIAASVANERWLMILMSIAAVFVVIAFCLDLIGKARSVGEWFADRRRWINKIGGMLAFLWGVIQEESLGPTDPDTPVERVARFDIVAGGIFVFVALVAVPLGAAVYFLGAEWVFGVLTPKGALGILALLNVLFILGFVLLYLSAFAAFAIGGVRDRNDHPEPVADVD